MDKYDIADKNGQDKVVSQLTKIFEGKVLKFTQHYLDKNTVDINMTVTCSSGNTYVYNLEAKDRTYAHDYFGSWMIEESKWDELTKREGKAYYVNTFPDGWITFWDLSKINKDEIKHEMRKLPKNTLEPQKGWVEKSVYYLPMSLACYSSSFI